MAQREAGLTPGMSNEEEMEFLQKAVRDVENRLVQTVQAIRQKVSYEALKNRALSEVRGVATKPKQLARSAAMNGYDMMKKAQTAARRQPVIPLVIAIAVLTPLLIGRIMRMRRRR